MLVIRLIQFVLKTKFREFYKATEISRILFLVRNAKYAQHVAIANSNCGKASFAFAS